VTAVAPQPITSRPYPARVAPKGSVFLKMLRTTDPKDIAILYLVTSFGFFMVGGLMAMLMRAELAEPGLQFLDTDPSAADAQFRLTASLPNTGNVQAV